MATLWLWLALYAVALAQSASNSLQESIDSLLDVPWLRFGYCGVVVRDLNTGETLYAREAEKMLIPASNTKLITSAAALSLLGAEYRVKTTVLAQGSLLPDGILEGNLVLRGGGDATLTYADLQSLARRVKQAGITQVKGLLLYDDSYLDAERYGFGWNIDDEPFGYQAQMSALCVERNAVRLFAKPGERENDPVVLRLEPDTDYVQIVNLTRTVPSSTPNTGLTVERPRALNRLIVSGTIAVGSEEVQVGRYAVENPSRYAAWLFRQALRGEGVKVEAIAPLLAPVGAARGVAEHLSPPMSEVVALINKPSDNLVSEMTLKLIGKEKRGQGTTAAGIQAMMEFLREAGLEMGAVNLVDGSGLSRMNMVSAENLVRLLTYMAKSPLAETYRDSLPVYGVDGTLRNRLRETPVQGKGFAKTGSLYRVSSLSGYLECRSGRVVVFAIVMNAYTTSASDARALQDRLVRLLWEQL
ncbi:MAG: D-alanyl-D-alanine carboxypeptidase/D-alanyl-D-alanine-endopeptidase [Fimbriimonadales bacterium]